MKRKLVTLSTLLPCILGRPGRLVSASKSCGPAMAIYNANVVVDGAVIWYGDIDLNISKQILIAVAKLFNTSIDIYLEHHMRVFPFEVVSDHEQISEDEYQTRLAALHSAKMQQYEPVWSTACPDLFNKEDYSLVAYERELQRAQNIKQRQIAYGILTPNGTSWKWYNTWYYVSIHKAYRIYRYHYKNIIRYSIHSADRSRQRALAAGAPYSYFRYLVKIGKNIIRELHYYKKAVCDDGTMTWKELLFDH